ncbi:hypothetical protein GCM10009850_056980 [Nonomuraea monospora]|uniref:Uncharacterized protein n=1 Tax=Nonomuraea monospora TaxID=568818 RepID=A0ABN3CLF8_9ACTN
MRPPGGGGEMVTARGSARGLEALSPGARGEAARPEDNSPSRRRGPIFSGRAPNGQPGKWDWGGPGFGRTPERLARTVLLEGDDGTGDAALADVFDAVVELVEGEAF